MESDTGRAEVDRRTSLPADIDKII